MRTILMRTSLLTPILLTLLFVAAGNSFGQAIDPEALYEIRARHSHQCLEVAGSDRGNGARVIQAECNNEMNQRWTFIPVGDGYYKIIAKHSNKALDVFGGIFSKRDGVIVEQWEYNGGDNQRWDVSELGGGIYTIIAKHSGKSLDIIDGSDRNGAAAQQWSYLGGGNQQWELTAFSNRPACAGVDSTTSSFRGTVNVGIKNVLTPYPLNQDINLPIGFSVCRTNVRITSFPAIVFTTSGWLGPNTATVTQIGGNTGFFDPNTGSLSILVKLSIRQSLETGTPIPAPSTLRLYLTTEEPGGQRIRDGNVTLVGSGLFTEGFLYGSPSTVKITGRLSPSP